MHASRPYCPPATTTGPEEQHGLLPVHIYAHFNCIIILIKRVYLRKKVVARLNSAITNSVNDSATIITAIVVDQTRVLTHYGMVGCFACKSLYGKIAVMMIISAIHIGYIRMKMEICTGTRFRREAEADEEAATASASPKPNLNRQSLCNYRHLGWATHGNPDWPSFWKVPQDINWFISTALHAAIFFGGLLQWRVKKGQEMAEGNRKHSHLVVLHRPLNFGQWMDAIYWFAMQLHCTLIEWRTAIIMWYGHLLLLLLLTTELVLRFVAKNGFDWKMKWNFFFFAIVFSHRVWSSSSWSRGGINVELKWSANNCQLQFASHLQFYWTCHGLCQDVLFELFILFFGEISIQVSWKASLFGGTCWGYHEISFCAPPSSTSTAI